MVDLVTFAACWLLGFAHRDGLLDALRARTVVAAAALCLVAGGWFAYTHPTDEGIDLGEIPLAQALWSAGFVLLLLRFRPRRMHRVPGADGAVGLLNARAVTVYLWHEVALFASVPLIDLMWDVPFFEAHLPLDATWFQFLTVWPLIGAAVVLVGWTEDLAARRRPRLWPHGRQETRAAGPRPRRRGPLSHRGTRTSSAPGPDPVRARRPSSRTTPAAPPSSQTRNVAAVRPSTRMAGTATSVPVSRTAAALRKAPPCAHSGRSGPERRQGQPGHRLRPRLVPERHERTGHQRHRPD